MNVISLLVRRLKAVSIEPMTAGSRRLLAATARVSDMYYPMGRLKGESNQNYSNIAQLPTIPEECYSFDNNRVEHEAEMRAECQSRCTSGIANAIYSLFEMLWNVKNGPMSNVINTGHIAAFKNRTFMS